ncbi:uncharacterized protein LOC106150574 [Lingula anatina]|uniref:Uncharacterized protein LOC106150574 n=1 Tax=Lingula anatina TaxID=7574 RepID=A0A1S3H0A0_LINAN|nr:uncharacterized protein LOC106150574 [Lingula anatina]|eukprot:XP_013378906.1 uncharacterized protein LOC106150574 [Lingula anatina]
MGKHVLLVRSLSPGWICIVGLLPVLLVCLLTSASPVCKFQHGDEILDIKWMKIRSDNTEICILTWSTKAISDWDTCIGIEGGIKMRLNPKTDLTHGVISLLTQNLSAADEGIYMVRIAYHHKQPKYCTFHLLQSGNSTLIEEGTKIQHTALGNTAQLNFTSGRNLQQFKLFNALNRSLVQCDSHTCSSNPNSGAAPRFMGRVTDSSIVVAINVTELEDSGRYWFEMVYKDRRPTTGKLYLRVYKLQDKGSEEVRPTTTTTTTTTMGKDLPGV